MKLKYNPEKGYFVGLPARDIESDEAEKLDQELLKQAIKLGMYVPEKKEVKENGK